MAVVKTQIPEEFRLETEVCGRCGGSGHYSYCQMYGTRCFGCHGSGKKYTKRGFAALQYLKGLLSKRYDQVAVGDTIKAGGCTNSGVPYDMWAKVVEIRHYDNSRNSGSINGVPMVMRSDLLEIQTNKVTVCGVAPESIVECLHKTDFVLETAKQAKAYEATLTKTGKPRKR